MQRVISAAQMRAIDKLTVQNHQVPSLQLMENAAKACFLEIKNFYSGNLCGKAALIVCGEGNNGGDGAALAQQLVAAGMNTRVVLLGSVENTKGDARLNFDKLQQLAISPNTRSERVLTLEECTTEVEWQALALSFSSWDLVVDAIFGTGLSRPLEGLSRIVVNDIQNTPRQASSKPSLILSVDIPSGLRADSSTAFDPAVDADLTVTFTAPKVANVLTPASDLNGRLVVADIGSPCELIETAASELYVLEQSDVCNWLVGTRYKPGSFKNTHGHVLVIAGSRGYTGAAVLCADAAMRSGAGLVTVAMPISAQPAISATAMSEVITAALPETDRGAVSDQAIQHIKHLSAKASVIAIGPGLTADDERTRKFVFSVVADRKVSVIIDADALNCLAPWPDSLKGSTKAPIVLTPHPGEMLRLLGTEDKSILDDRVSTARDFAAKHDVILVLKGSRTIVAANQKVFINPTGNAGLGTAGSGDTLTGLIGGFVAQEVGTFGETADVLKATLAALYVGGMAGDLAASAIGMRTLVASDIRAYLGEAIRTLDPEGERPPTK